MSIEELRRRVHAAADRIEVPPPPADLLSGEVRRLPGRRRGLGVALAAAAAVLAVVGIGAVVVDRDDRDPAVTSGTERATAGALLSVALDHVEVDPSSFEALDESDLRYGRGTVGGDIRFDAEEGYEGDLLRVTATPGRLPKNLCDTVRTCARSETDAGRLVVSWELALPEEDPGTVLVALQSRGEWHTAYYAGQLIDRDPREIDSLPVSVAEMTAIVTDPRFGLRTTAEAVEAGKALDVAGEGRPDADGGALDDWSPRVLAGFVQDQLGNVRSASPSTYDEPAGPTGEGEGIQAQLAVGTRLELLLVTEPGPRPLACPEGYRCYRGDRGVVYAWTPAGSDLAILRDRGDFAVRLWISDPAFRVTSREDFLDNLLVRLADLTEHPGLAPRMRADHAEVPVPGWSE